MTSALPDALIGHRRDIDGLRAVAVASVVLHHASLGPVHGGFVGVDIFFVISGFLITRILYRDISAGRFSIIGFYDRRIRRLFPALFTMLAVVSLLGWAFLSRPEYSSLAPSAIAATAFVSNIFFVTQTGYFAPEAAQMPLLHTWSLAVEEQFYILYPIILIVLLRCGGGRRLAITIVGLTLFSLGLAHWGVRARPEFAYYLLPTRAWELLIGALLALPILSAPSRQLAEPLAAAGLAMILVAVAGFDRDTAVPASRHFFHAWARP